MAGLTVITGPPCSGKTTYLRQHARPGDITIDLDTIAQALGSPVTHGHSQAHKDTAMAARTAAITHAITWVQRGTTAWIIDSTPHTMAAYYRNAQAHIVHLTAPPDELHRRAMAAGRPPSWHHLIDQWAAAETGSAGHAKAQPNSAATADATKPNEHAG